MALAWTLCGLWLLAGWSAISVQSAAIDNSDHRLEQRIRLRESMVRAVNIPFINCRPDTFPRLRIQGFCSNLANLDLLCPDLEISQAAACAGLDGSFCCYISLAQGNTLNSAAGGTTAASTVTTVGTTQSTITTRPTGVSSTSASSTALPTGSTTTQTTGATQTSAATSTTQQPTSTTRTTLPSTQSTPMASTVVSTTTGTTAGTPIPFTEPNIPTRTSTVVSTSVASTTQQATSTTRTTLPSTQPTGAAATTASTIASTIASTVGPTVASTTGITRPTTAGTPIPFTEPFIPTQRTSTTQATTTATTTPTLALERCGIPNSNSDFFTNLEGVTRAMARDYYNISGPAKSGNRVDINRIVGGFEVPNGAGSECWQVQMLITFADGSVSYCGASIIGSRTVMSASHCLIKGGLGTTDNFNLRANPVRVQTGPTVLPRTDFFFNGAPFQSVPGCGEIINVARVVTVPGYNGRITPNNDIVIFILERDIDFTAKSACACKLCVRRQGPQVGDICLVSGFGSEVLREVDPPEGVTVPFSEPRDLLPLKITTQVVRPNDFDNCVFTNNVDDITLFICAGGTAPTDSCQGDSGGPLFCFDQPSGRQYLAGIVSHGRGCGAVGVASMYTDMAKYFDNFLLPNIPAGQLTFLPPQ